MRLTAATVLQAEENLFPAELNQASTRAQLFNSLVSIYQAMGGGWVERADALAPQPSAAALPPRDPTGSRPHAEAGTSLNGHSDADRR